MLTATTLSYNIPGVPNDLHLDGADDRRHLPRHDHELERPDDRSRSTRSSRFRTWRSPRCTARTARVTPTRSPTTSSASARRSGVERRQHHARHLAGRGRRERQRGRRRRHREHPGRDRLHQRRLHAPEPPQGRGGQERRGRLRDSGPQGHRGRGAAAFTKPTSTAQRRRDAHRRPAEDGEDAYPISTYSYIIFPTVASKATELRKMIFWALTQGNKKYGAEADLRADPDAGPRAAEKALKSDPTAPGPHRIVPGEDGGAARRPSVVGSPA